MVSRFASLACAVLMMGLVPPLQAERSSRAADLMIVHCALPGQIRQMGQRATYVSPRRPVKVSAQECRIRGGEYVRSDAASLKSALSVWLASARAGDPEAQTTLGEIFEQGLGVPPDYAAAAVWYRRAAEQGETRAMINLGFLLEKGLGQPADPKAALDWYRRAAGVDVGIRLDVDRQDELSRLVQTLKSQIETLRGALSEARARAAPRQREVSENANDTRLADLAERLAERERALVKLRQEIEARGADERLLADLKARLVRQDERLQRAERAADENDRARSRLAAELGARLDQIEAQERALAEQSARIAELLTAKAPAVPLDVDLEGPSLSLVQPRLSGTRGLVKVALGSGAPTEQIIGRVSAPAGLLALSVNGNAVEANPAGVFTHRVERSSARRSVSVVAVDQRGQRAELRFELANEAVPASPPLPDVELGNFHALLIGNSDYANLPRLMTPKNDVRRLSQILQARYGYQVTVLEDATRYQILSALNDLRGRLSRDDNLLVFYAGHGELDETNMRGHWLPVDAEASSTANWVSNVAITDILNVMQARQVMLVVDSCYSGTLTRSSIAQLDTGMTDEERATWLKLLAEKRARVVLSSGGLAPVLDMGGGAHSVFAKSLIDVLEHNVEMLTGRSLYQAVAARVAHAASRYEFEQIPQYAPVARAGHEAGDFFLLPRL